MEQHYHHLKQGSTITLSSCFTKFTQNKQHHILLPSFLLSLQDQDTLLENFLTVSQLYQKPQLSTVSYLEQLLCGMPYLLMFNKQAQSMLLRSFSNPILKFKPSTILLCSLFLFFFSWFFLLLLFPFSSFSACYAPYFSSTGTQPGKYWFTFSAILFKMFLKSGLQCMSSIMRPDRSQNSVDRKSYDWWLERQISALTCRIRPLHGTTILVKKATLDLCWERQLLDILWQRTLETTTHSDSTPVFQGQCQNSSVFCWHTAFAFRSSFHQQPSSQPASDNSWEPRQGHIRRFG